MSAPVLSRARRRRPSSSGSWDSPRRTGSRSGSTASGRRTPGSPPTSFPPPAAWKTPASASRAGTGPKHAGARTNDLSDDSLRAVVARSEQQARLAPDDPEDMPLLGAQTYVPGEFVFRIDGRTLSGGPGPGRPHGAGGDPRLGRSPGCGVHRDPGQCHRHRQQRGAVRLRPDDHAPTTPSPCAPATGPAPAGPAPTTPTGRSSISGR